LISAPSAVLGVLRAENLNRASKLPPATVKLPEKPAQSESETVPAQKALALKAATRAIRATGGNGFRIPAAKPGKSRRPKHRHGRGPPR